MSLVERLESLSFDLSAAVVLPDSTSKTGRDFLSEVSRLNVDRGAAVVRERSVLLERTEFTISGFLTLRLSAAEEGTRDTVLADLV